jgi:hypothetical protein
MNEIRIGASALRLTVDPPRNEDMQRSFQPMYHPEAAADPDLMKPSPAFDSEFVKRSVRVAAFVLATLPLVACVVLTAMVIF